LFRRIGVRAFQLWLWDASDKKNIVTLSLKDVLGYPLTRDFREKLCGDTVP
jgi:hypothetical protein